ncbi:MAG: hypothetical protein QM779_10375 [Propionicimonas sp.]|uniref:hypothetical protein n=1 Tax=Propionicimonas sp. TaxID=1955623 RepID=UPI003D0F72BC
MTSEAAAALRATVEDFHPGASVSEVATRSGDVPFRGLPDLNRPRLLVPGAPGRAASRALLRFSVALSTRDAVSRIGAAAAIRVAGVGRVLPAGLAVRGGTADDLSSHLAGQLGEPVVFGVGVGTARANRKPVLEVFSRRSGDTLAFAKVGDNPVASERVRAEATALGEIAGRLGPRFEVPELISLTRWNDHDVLLLTPLRTVPQFFAGRRVPTGLMRDFSESFDAGSAPLVEAPQWRRMQTAALPPAPVVDRWRELFDRLGNLAHDRPDLRVGAWHGDWTAWNMAWRGRRLQLWDFERFETGVVRGLDAVHYPVNDVLLRKGLTAAAVLDGVARGTAALGNGEEADLIAAAYLVAITFRYLESVGQGGESLVAERTRVILDALELWLEKLVVGGRGGR